MVKDKNRTIQEIIFELIERSSFNNFDGKRVVSDLKSHENLWEAVIMDREALEGQLIDLIKLRDISNNEYNVDTIFIMPKKFNEVKLYKLAKKWKADDIDWIGGEKACRLLGAGLEEIRNNTMAILRIWWD